MEFLLASDRARVRAGLMALLAMSAVSTGSVSAGEVHNAANDQAEWAQLYEGDAGRLGARETIPTLSAETIQGTISAIDHYKSIVAKGGWRPMPSGVGLHLGSTGPAVMALRERLGVTGDLNPEAAVSPVFDSYVEAGVKNFQARHGLSPNGIVTSETLTALNIPAEDRLKQLLLNVVRLRTLSGNLGRRFVMANIPAAEVETVEEGTVVGHHAAGVGKADRQSPTLQAKAIEVNFNPYWHGAMAGIG